MATKTGIEWTDATWNPWMGCTKVSAGCKHCYMFREQRQYGQDPEVLRRSKTKFRDPLRWAEPRRVFTCSWSDWFHEGADAWRAEAWEIVRKTPQHTYQVLTKRPERIAAHLPPDWGGGYPNVWLGVSVEDQQRADERIPLLLQAPAAVRFISAEPLLGPVDLSMGLGRSRRIHLKADIEGMLRHRSFDGLQHDDSRPMTRREAENELYALHAKGVKFLPVGPCEDFDPQSGCPGHPNPRLDWVIVGGESGAKARPMDLSWASSIVEQCRKAEVAVFVKQLGGWPDKQGDPTTWPEDLRVREFPEVPA